MPGAEPHAVGLTVAASSVSLVVGSGEPHAEGVPVAASAFTEVQGSVNRELLDAGPELSMHATVCTPALADRRGMAIPGLRRTLRGRHCRSQTPVILSGAAGKGSKKAASVSARYMSAGSQPFRSPHTHSSSRHTVPVFAAFAGAGGHNNKLTRSKTHTCKPIVLLPTCARAGNPTLSLLPDSRQLIGLPFKYSTVYCRRAALLGPLLHATCALAGNHSLSLPNSIRQHTESDFTLKHYTVSSTCVTLPLQMQNATLHSPLPLSLAFHEQLNQTKTHRNPNPILVHIMPLHISTKGLNNQLPFPPPKPETHTHIPRPYYDQADRLTNSTLGPLVHPAGVFQSPPRTPPNLYGLYTVLTDPNQLYLPAATGVADNVSPVRHPLHLGHPCTPGQGLRLRLKGAHLWAAPSDLLTSLAPNSAPPIPTFTETDYEACIKDHFVSASEDPDIIQGCIVRGQATRHGCLHLEATLVCNQNHVGIATALIKMHQATSPLCLPGISFTSDDTPAYQPPAPPLVYPVQPGNQGEVEIRVFAHFYSPSATTNFQEFGDTRCEQVFNIMHEWVHDFAQQQGQHAKVSMPTTKHAQAPDPMETDQQPPTPSQTTYPPTSTTPATSNPPPKQTKAPLTPLQHAIRHEIKIRAGLSLPHLRLLSVLNCRPPPSYPNPNSRLMLLSMSDPAAASMLREAKEVTISREKAYVLSLMVVDTSSAALQNEPLDIQLNPPNTPIDPPLASAITNAVITAAWQNPCAEPVHTRLAVPPPHTPKEDEDASSSISKLGQPLLANVITGTAMDPYNATSPTKNHAIHAFTTNTNTPAITLPPFHAPGGVLRMYFANPASLALASLTIMHPYIEVPLPGTAGQYIRISTSISPASPNSNFPTAIQLPSHMPHINHRSIDQRVGGMQPESPQIAAVSLAKLASIFTPGQPTASSFFAVFQDLAKKRGRQQRAQLAFAQHTAQVLINIVTRLNPTSLPFATANAQHDAELSQQISDAITNICSTPTNQQQQQQQDEQEEAAHLESLARAFGELKEDDIATPPSKHKASGEPSTSAKKGRT